MSKKRVNGIMEGILRTKIEGMEKELEALKVVLCKYTKCTALSDTIVFVMSEDHVNVHFQPAVVHLT